MRQLVVVFGGTAPAVAVTTAAFFAGLGLGSWWWGSRTTRISDPLYLYGWLEIGVAVAAMGYFVVADLNALIELQASDDGSRLNAMRFVLAVLLVCPATFLMGGALPLLGQSIVPRLTGEGETAGLIYGVHTLGAVSGAIAAGFLLPRILGLQNAYLSAVVLSLATGVASIVLARGTPQRPGATHLSVKAEETLPPTASALTSRHLYLAAFASGAISLALQVLWVQMFARIWHHSGATFAAILTSFLVSLTAGAFIVRVSATRFPATNRNLVILLVIAGVSCLSTPFLFEASAEGFLENAWIENLPVPSLSLLIASFIIIGWPMILAGTILPSLYRFTTTFRAHPGQQIGLLQGCNLIGSIIGSLAAGFLLLPLLGLWDSIRLVALAYLVLAIVLADEIQTRATAIALLAVSFLFSDHGGKSGVRLGPGEQLIEAWQDGSGSVSVVTRQGQLSIRIDDWYTLGGTGEIVAQTTLTHLPMQIHPTAQRLLYLGLGTGISAGAAMSYPVTDVLVTELSGNVIRASRQYFGNWTNGLYHDQRARVIYADGRTLVRGSDSQYDLVIGDLFVPWRRGIGSMYTVEHFTTVQSRLRPDGLFVQWLPLYQLTESEFIIIARTMTAVFDQVTLWRGDFRARLPLFALIGHRKAAPLDPQSVLVSQTRRDLAQLAISNDQPAPLLSYFVTTLSGDQPTLRSAPLSTEDKPLVEYLAVDSLRRQRRGEVRWLTTEPLIDLLDRLHGETPPGIDPYLSRLDGDLIGTVHAGRLFHRAAAQNAADDQTGRLRSLEEARRLLHLPAPN